MRWTWIGCLLVAVLLGLGLRLFALNGEFWLDEILSYRLAQEAGSPLGVFSIKNDNNHHLNTAWLALWPQPQPWWLYRLHSLVAGVASIVIAACIARRWSLASAVVAAWLFACNFWLILFSAEARGYSLAVLFSLCAFGLLWLYLDERRWQWLIGYWLACALGFLSHLTFLHVYLGFVIWSLRRFSLEKQRPFEDVRRFVICHFGVGCFFVPFYLLCIRGMHVEGAPPGSVAPVVGRLLAVGLGGESSLSLVYGAIFVVLLLSGLWSLREPTQGWTFFVVTIVASPGLFLLTRPPFVFERYLLLPFVFFLLLSAHLLGLLWNRGSLVGRIVLILFLAKYSLSSAIHVTRFSRGEFHQALAFVLDSDPNEPVVVTGDNDFRVRAMVDFYARYHSDRRIEYVSNQHPERATWILTHRLNATDPVPDQVRDPAGVRYELKQGYPAKGPFAWGWFAYRRER